MPDIKEMAVQYWPWLLGGTIGLWLIAKMGNGGESSGESGFDPVQGQMALEGMRISTESADTRYIADVQAHIGMGKNAVEMQSVVNQRDVAMYSISTDAAVKVAEMQGAQTIAYMTTQAAIEQQRITGATTVATAQIGGAVQIALGEIAGMTQINVAEINAGVDSIYAYKGILEELNAPTLASIDAATIQNLAAIQSFTTLGVESFRVKGDVAKSAIGGLYNLVGNTGANMTATGLNFAPVGLPGQEVQRPDMKWLTDIVGSVAGIFKPGENGGGYSGGVVVGPDGIPN